MSAGEFLPVFEVALSFVSFTSRYALEGLPDLVAGATSAAGHTSAGELLGQVLQVLRPNALGNDRALVDRLTAGGARFGSGVPRELRGLIQRQLCPRTNAQSSF